MTRRCAKIIYKHISLVTGYYMYIETSYHQPGDNAILISPKFSFSGKRCLQFYYHMYGASMGTLNVFLNGARVFTACGDKGNKWLKAAIDVNLQGMHVVRYLFSLQLLCLSYLDRDDCEFMCNTRGSLNEFLGTVKPNQKPPE